MCKPMFEEHCLRDIWDTARIVSGESDSAESLQSLALNVTGERPKRFVCQFCVKGVENAGAFTGEVWHFFGRRYYLWFYEDRPILGMWLDNEVCDVVHKE